MTIKQFVRKAVEQDERNVFTNLKEEIHDIPKEIMDFYKKYNPVDVEVSINNSIVRFVPYDELKSVQNEYSLEGDRFIFATSNGEPIYLKESGIYTCLFSKKGIVEEKIIDSFEEYIGLID